MLLMVACFNFSDKFILNFHIQYILACNSGQFWDASTQQCVDCPINTYTNTNNADTCTPCPEGQVTTGEGNTHCRTGKHIFF